VLLVLDAVLVLHGKCQVEQQQQAAVEWGALLQHQVVV